MVVSWLVSVTVAFGTAAPDASRTVPRTSAVSNCAKSAVAIRKQPRNSVVFKSLFTSLTSNRFSQANIDRRLHLNYRCVTVARKRRAFALRFSCPPPFEAGRTRFQFPRQGEQQDAQKSGNQDAVKRGVPSITLRHSADALTLGRAAQIAEKSDEPRCSAHRLLGTEVEAHHRQKHHRGINEEPNDPEQCQVQPQHSCRRSEERR